MMKNEFNINEEWIKLKENEIPQGKRYAITKLLDDEIGTKIFLDNEIFAVEIFFDGIPLLVRRTSEDGARMRTWSSVMEKYNDKYFFKEHFFFEVKNSELTEWIKEEGCGAYDSEQITHYCVLADDGCIDILSTFKPLVTVSKIKS